jgi:hypothetical protein
MTLKLGGCCQNLLHFLGKGKSERRKFVLIWILLKSGEELPRGILNFIAKKAHFKIKMSIPDRSWQPQFVEIETT